MVSARGGFAPRDIWQGVGPFLIVALEEWGDATGFLWAEARDAKSPRMHRTVPTVKDYLAPNVKSAEVETPYELRHRVAPSW